MTEGDTLWDDACSVSDLRAHLKGLADHELRMLANHAAWLCGKQTKAGGVPVIVQGLCDLEAAHRFYQAK